MNDPIKTETAAETADRMEKRDGELYIALGIFIMAVGLPVLIGTYWAAQVKVHAAVVNAACGGVLLLIGAASLAYGFVVLARNARRG
jgi:hypothetical protein